jgi:hypothetical protein
VAASSETISFRLPAELVEELVELASDHNARHNLRGDSALSRTEFAKRLFIDALTDSEREKTRAELARLADEVCKLREDIATVLTSLLVNIAKADQREVEAWVRAALLR